MIRAVLLVAVWTITVLVGTPLWAAQGKAYIPSFLRSQGGSNHTYDIHLSNITHKTIRVKIKLFDQSGNLVQDGDDSEIDGDIRVYYGSFTNYDDDPTGASVSFYLDARNTVMVRLVAIPDKRVGYGTIEWRSSSDELGDALIAHGAYWIEDAINQYRGIGIPINQGQPF